MKKKCTHKKMADIINERGSIIIYDFGWPLSPGCIFDELECGNCKEKLKHRFVVVREVSLEEAMAQWIADGFEDRPTQYRCYEVMTD